MKTILNVWTIQVSVSFVIKPIQDSESWGSFGIKGVYVHIIHVETLLAIYKRGVLENLYLAMLMNNGSVNEMRLVA